MQNSESWECKIVSILSYKQFCEIPIPILIPVKTFVMETVILTLKYIVFPCRLYLQIVYNVVYKWLNWCWRSIICLFRYLQFWYLISQHTQETKTTLLKRHYSCKAIWQRINHLYLLEHNAIHLTHLPLDSCKLSKLDSSLKLPVCFLLRSLNISL